MVPSQKLLLVFITTIFCLFLSCSPKKSVITDNKELISQIDSIYNISEHLVDIGDKENAYNTITTALKFCEKNGSKYGIIKGNYLLCNLFYSQNFKDSAAFYGEKGLANYYENNADEQTTKIAILNITRLALLYIETGNFSISYRYIFRSQKMIEPIKDTEFLLEYNSRIAYAYYNLSQFEDAQKFYNQKIVILRKQGLGKVGKLYLQGVYRDIGLTYFNIKKFNTAIAYYDSAIASLHFEKKLDNDMQKKVDIAVGIIRGNKGQALAAQKKYTAAIKELIANIKINNRIGYDNIDATSSLIALGGIYLQLSKINDFERLMKTSDSLYDARSTNVYFTRLIKLKALAYEKVTNKKEGYELLKKFIIWNDSATASLIKYNLRYKLGKIDINKRNQEIAYLNYQTENNKNLFYRSIVVGILLIILLVISIVFLFNYRRNDKKLRKLYTQIERNQIALEQSNLDMQKMVLEKNNILGIVAHDLKSPLSSIKGLTLLLESDLLEKKQLDIEQTRFISYLKVSINHMNAVTDDLLEISSLESSNTKLEMQNVSINDLINETILVFEIKAKEKFITIKTDIEQNLFHTLNIKKMERAIGNLLNNAIKFSYPGSEINIVAKKEDENLLISISDNGIGIEDSNLNNVFVRFTKSKTIGTAGEKPVGMGLSIVKQIVDKHFGTISVKSEKGVGTTFTIIFQNQ